MGDYKEHDYEDDELVQVGELVQDDELVQNDVNSTSKMSNKSILVYCGLYLSIMTIAIFGVQFIVSAIVAAFFPDAADASWFNVALTMLGIVGVGLPIYIKLMKRIPDSEKSEKKNISPGKFTAYFIVCIAATYISNLVGSFISALIEIFKGFEIVDPLNDFIFNSNLILMMTYAVIIAPIVEEVIFRKILLDKLRRFGDLPAILLTGFAFGIFHFNLPQFFYATVLGILFAYITIRTNRLIYPIVLHMMVNAIGAGIAPMIAANQNPIAAGYLSIWVLGSMTIGSILFIINIRKILIIKPKRPLVRKRDYILNPGSLLFLAIGISVIVLNIVA